MEMFQVANKMLMEQEFYYSTSKKPTELCKFSPVISEICRNLKFNDINNISYTCQQHRFSKLWPCFPRWVCSFALHLNLICMTFWNEHTQLEFSYMKPHLMKLCFEGRVQRGLCSPRHTALVLTSKEEQRKWLCLSSLWSLGWETGVCCAD